MSKKQIEYQARRKFDAEYKRKMHDKYSAGNLRDKRDSAYSSARLAYNHYISHNIPSDGECELML